MSDIITAGKFDHDAYVTAAKEYVGDYWWGGADVLSRLSKDAAEDVLKDTFATVLRVPRVRSPLLANRTVILKKASELARLYVLLLEPAPLEDVLGYRGLLGITGELRPELPKIITTVHTELREHFAHLPNEATFGAAVRVLIDRMFVVHLQAMLFNHLRSAVGDAGHEEHDWFQPYMQCLCAVEEHQLRLFVVGHPALPAAERVQIDALIDGVGRGQIAPMSEWDGGSAKAAVLRWATSRQASRAVT